MENTIEDVNITEDLRKSTFEFLESNKIVMSNEVRNCLDQAFDENDFIGLPDDDDVKIYFQEDLDIFLTDTLKMSKLNIQYGNHYSSGIFVKSFTYYGIIDMTNAYSEDIAIYDGEELKEQVSYKERTDLNKLVDKDDFCIIVIEETEFHMGEYNVTPRLLIYVPISGENIQ